MSTKKNRIEKTKYYSDPIDAHIGSRIKSRRNSLGMTQQQLAKILTISFQQVQKYEKGINRMAPRRLLEVGHALKVNVSYFFEGMDHKEIPFCSGLAEDGPPLQLSSPSLEEELLGYFSSISNPYLRQQIINLVKTISYI